MKKFFIVVLVIAVMLSLTVPAMAFWGCPKDGADGADGADGYTPVKNVDYFDGYTPVKDVDYFDGANGATGAEGRPGRDFQRNDKIGLGLDVNIYERGDPIGNLNDVTWLKEINVESRIDLNNGKPQYEGYVVLKIKPWNK